MPTRKRAGSLLFALLFGLSLVVGAKPAYACSCADVPLEDDVRDADVVFSGEVRSIDEEASVGSGPLAATGRITFAVEDSWKEITPQAVDVHGQGDGVNCYNTFEEGEAYLVYASRAEGADTPLKNIGCGETKPLAAAEADLRLLGPPVDELPETGGVPLEGAERWTGPTLAVAAAVLVSLAAGAVFAGRISRGPER